MQEIMKSICAAPLQGFTEAAWRNAHERVFGAVDTYYTPFVRLEKGTVRNKDRREVAAAQNQVQHLVPQIVAATPEELAALVTFLCEQGYDEIDLNMGCPFPLIVNKGKGAGLLPFPDRVKALLDEMKHWPQVRFSVKMRLGWEVAEEWKELLPLLNVSCVKQLTLHPRIGRQQYKGKVDMEAFRAFYAQCELPLIYNGDIQHMNQALCLLEEYPALNGVMLGRGLLADPSLAVAIRTGKPMSQKELYQKVYEMHQLMYAHYDSVMEGGETQLVQKLKTMWEYLLPDLEKKVRKQILKSSRLEQYLQCVAAALC